MREIITRPDMLLITTYAESQPPMTSFYYCSPEEVAKMLKNVTSGYHGKLSIAASDPMMDDEPRKDWPLSLQCHKKIIKEDREGGILYSPPVPCPLKSQ